MAHAAFPPWREALLRSRTLAPLRLGASQEDVMALFGHPDVISTFRQKGRPLIFKYLDVEFHFDPHRNHSLWLIHVEDAEGNPILSLQ